ncbi:MAG TPA: DUF3107 domain-containing protein [Acidimicrobiales bacterium]|nr:DUF3107 domain-containing protein [Acidimicrobiales bacterium]
MDVRIGITQTPKEIDVEMGDGVDQDELVKEIDSALGSPDGVLWLTDRRGRRIGVPSGKVAYVEIGTPADDRRVGFGAH